VRQILGDDEGLGLQLRALTPGPGSPCARGSVAATAPERYRASGARRSVDPMAPGSGKPDRSMGDAGESLTGDPERLRASIGRSTFLVQAIRAVRAGTIGAVEPCL